MVPAAFTGGTVLGNDSRSYSFAWEKVSDGKYTITVNDKPYNVTVTFTDNGKTMKCNSNFLTYGNVAFHKV